MADKANARGPMLIRADRSVEGRVTFYDARVQEAAAARIGCIDVQAMCVDVPGVPAQVIRAAVHGYTQNVLDSSNKLTGDERVAFVAKACDTINAGGWASAPVDEAAAAQRAIDALVKAGFSLSEARAFVESKG